MDKFHWFVVYIEATGLYKFASSGCHNNKYISGGTMLKGVTSVHDEVTSLNIAASFVTGVENNCASSQKTRRGSPANASTT